jgi:hypothetical protein
MAEVKVTIHSSGTGICALTGKEGDGIQVSFDDQTVTNSFLSWKAFRQILAMKASKAKVDPKPALPESPRVPVAAPAVPQNGATVVSK